jgi:two-component system, chemotaxis family, chemotaxis protein CheY
MHFNVIACPNGKDAWDKLKDATAKGNEKNVVAVISDLMMPEEDGMALLKRVRADEATKHLPFVFVTAVSDKPLVQMAKENGVQGYILKPVTFVNVQNKLKELFPTRAFPKVVAA